MAFFNRHCLVNTVFALLPVFMVWAGVGISSAVAQQKYEHEESILESEVPTNALDFINNLGDAGKVKWYFEEGWNTSSIEAKFKLSGQKFSIEFDTSGHLQDVEILTKWDELPALLRSSITASLDYDCSTFKIKKIQVHYAGDSATLLDKIKTGRTENTYTTNYELVIKCRTPKKTALYEYLFSETGERISVALITFDNTSNLEY